MHPKRPSIVKPLLAIGGVIISILVMHYAPSFAVIAFSLALTYASVLSALFWAKKARWFSFRDLVRALRSLHRFFRASPLALMLYAVGLGLGVLSAALQEITKSPVTSTIFGVLIGMTLCIATVVDWCARLKKARSTPMLKRALALAVTFFATATVFVSTTLAKQLTHNISHVDPTATPEFVSLAATFIFPFALLLAVFLALTAVMVVQYVVLLTAVIGSIPFQFISPMFSAESKVRWFVTRHRILHGERPDEDLLPENQRLWQRFTNNAHHFLRPLGTAIVVIAISTVISGLSKLHDYIPGNYLQSLLVMADYRHSHQCSNVPESTAVAYLQDGYVSVATRITQGYKFSVEKCMKPTP